MSDRTAILLGDKSIGLGQPPYVIAEAGVNHNGDPELALALVDAAANAGADAVKFQTFTADALAAATAPLAQYQRRPDSAESQREMLRRLELSRSAVARTKARAEERGIGWLSTPFDVESVEELADLGVPAFKVSSGDLTNLVLLRAIARFGRPIIVSTGMATMEEVEIAVRDLRSHGNPPLVVLQCVSAYPASPRDVHLRAMATMREKLGLLVGFSDHTGGIGAAIAAAALGASVIEKHITLDRSLPGPDHAASLDVESFRLMVEGIHDAYAALGCGVKAPQEAEADVRRVARRSLVTARDLDEGHVITMDDLVALRPGTGISPMYIDQVVGRTLSSRLQAGLQLTEDLIGKLSSEGDDDPST